MLAALQREAALDGTLDWDTHSVDGTVVRAHQHAARAVGEQHAEALGRSCGGFSTKIHTKIHIRAEGGGKPMALVIAGGERHESQYLNALLDATQVRRRDREWPRSRPRRLVGEKGYSYPTVRRSLARRHIHAVIPRRRDPHPGDRRHAPFDHAAYRGRNHIERLVNRLKPWRRIATRYEKRFLGAG